MKATEIQRRILSLATEDFYGLWEVPAVVKDVFPDLDEQHARELSEKILRELIDRHLIRIYRGTRFAGEERPLADTESESALTDASNWRHDVSIAKEHVRISATEIGEREYYNLTEH